MLLRAHAGATSCTFWMIQIQFHRSKQNVMAAGYEIAPLPAIESCHDYPQTIFSMISASIDWMALVAKANFAKILLFIMTRINSGHPYASSMAVTSLDVDSRVAAL